MEMLAKNSLHTVTIDGWSSDGAGVCRIDGRAVFVPRAMPGEQWLIKIVKVTSGAVFARGEELLAASPHRCEPDCPAYGKCGGCTMRHMDYAAELDFKLRRVNDAYRHIARLDLTAGEIIGADSTESYRNKAIYAIGSGPVKGFFRQRSHQVIPVERCLIQQPAADAAAGAVCEFMRMHGIPAYDEASGSGLVRHVFTRSALRTGQVLICVVAAGGFGSLTGALCSHLRGAVPQCTGIVLNVNRSRGNTVLAGDFYTLWGSGTVHDTLCALDFELSPMSFYQVNPVQAEKLYAKALEYAAPAGGELVLDLYCGAGTISLCLARGAGQVIGAEIVPEAVENARENARRNGIENVRFICADASQAAQQLAREGLRPDAVVVDPPRKGLAADVIDAVCAMAPERVVYVSCDVATQARDLAVFAEKGYVPRAAAAVDMFPRTAHVETVCLLVRRSSPHADIDADAGEMPR